LKLILIVFVIGYLPVPLYAQTPQLLNGEYRTDLNGISHWYKIAGTEHKTVPIVIVHGGPGGSVYNFERTAGLELEKFFTVIYYDQRGSGRSAAPPDVGNYSIPLLVSDLEALREALALDHMIPLGFSFGGELALEYALAHPERIEKLILQSPTAGDWERLYRVQLYGFQAVSSGELARQVREIAQSNEPLEKRYDRIWSIVDAKTVDRLLFHNQKAAQLNRRLWDESGLRNTGQMFHALRGQLQAAEPLLPERAKQLESPVLALVGFYDRNVGVDAIRDLTTAIPDVKLAIFDNSAHFPDIEETAKYATLIRTFLTDKPE
jgi:proline iminopeptidase